MFKKILIVSLVMAVSAALLFRSDVTGRDLVDKGAVVTRQGILQHEDLEWYLLTENISYQLHFGPRDYLSQTGLELEKGNRITIVGFSSATDIAVVEAADGEKSYHFRNENGRPFWAGNGMRKRQEENRRLDVPFGMNRKNHESFSWKENAPLRERGWFEMNEDNRKNREEGLQKNRRNWS